MPLDRRRFLAAGAAALLAGATPTARAAAPKLKKAVKYAMIKEGKSVREKFELIKSLGFLGVETDSPSNLNKEEARQASADTGIAVHGVIDNVHWNKTHVLSSTDPAVRARGLQALKNALSDAQFLGATTVLLVPGVARDGVTYEQCWERSQAEVRKALPHAERCGVKIAIEVVWNDFLTKPEQLIEYVDSFQSPWVGAYFDCSNMVKYGVPSAEWIRRLGKRMLKFDFKGYSKAKGWVPIGEGDENWPEILKALDEVGYHGWATAEVAGGGRKELQEVADRMNKILGLG